MWFAQPWATGRPLNLKGTALLSAVKPAESRFSDCGVERRDQTRGARRCDPAPFAMEQTDDLQNLYRHTSPRVPHRATRRHRLRRPEMPTTAVAAGPGQPFPDRLWLGLR